jgi:pimeloyl-ACP methyl ester carboxylesterase
MRQEATMSTIQRPTQLCMLESGPIEYRLERRGPDVLLVMHGGHMQAGLALGENAFAAAGFTVLAPSRPGYGRTPLDTGPMPSEFTDAVAALCARLGITRVAAAVGISGGGPTAVTMAARHPGLVQRVVLVSAVGFLPWPDRRIRLGSHVVFRPGVEALAWAGVRLLIRLAGTAALRMLLTGASTHPAGSVVAGLRDHDRDTLLALFAQMRSGHGFVNDLRPVPDTSAEVTQPALVIATRSDAGVPFAHAEALAAAIPAAELVESRAASHLVWFSPDWPAIAERVVAFLTAPVPPAPRAVADQATAARPATVTADEATGPVLHRPLRVATAALATAGALLAAGTSGPAFVRLGVGEGLAFVAVAVALAGLAAGVLRRSAWVTRVSVLGLAGQPVIVAGALWQVWAGMPAGKAAELYRLGVAPQIGAWINLGYGVLGAGLFGWLVARWWRNRAVRRG